MFMQVSQTRWKPVETTGWARRAYGRRVELESEGGTLIARLDPGGLSAPLTLNCAVTGRMLIQMYCDGEQVLDELVAHGPLSAQVDLARFRGRNPVELELHLIPGPVGAVKVPQQLGLCEEVAQPRESGCLAEQRRVC